MKTMTGVERELVKLVEYDPQWPFLFEKEKTSLKELLGDKVLSIEHIGSTSIPGVPSKPILDIDIAISSLNDAEYFIDKLPLIGYKYLDQTDKWVETPRYKKRRFFVKETEGKTTHHLKIVEISDQESWGDQILFRDYLRTHQDARESYIELKRSLADQYEHDRKSYTASKVAFIQEILNKAK
ncbi:MAG: yqkA [Patescibacteria group bacterium]|nr:yqkA [Patescibacteria group bacterium]